MKKIYFALAAVLTIGMLLTSCKEEEQKKVIHQSEEAEKTSPASSSSISFVVEKLLTYTNAL